MNISGAELGKSYSLVTTGLKINGETKETAAYNFTMPSVESLYNAKLSVTDDKTVIKADGASSVLVTFTLTDSNGVEVKDNNMEVAFTATFGTFAEKRVTVQDGKATALFNSEVLDTDRSALLTATVVEASDKNLINVKAEKNILLSPNPDSAQEDNVGATLTDIAAEMADRVILYFNKDVDVANYVASNTKNGYDASKLEVNITDAVNNDLTGGTAKTIVGLKAVPGNSKALYAILATTDTLTDNSRLKVEVKDKVGTVATSATKSTVLTDARRPSILGVSRDGLNKVVVTFSEPVKNVGVTDSAADITNWVIDGVRLDGAKWGDTTAATATVGTFNPTKGEDSRHIVTIELGKDANGDQIYFQTGTHSIQGANIGDWANRTDAPNNVINTQTLDFEIPEDNEAPTATVEVQSPEQYVVTFNKTILQNAGTLSPNLKLQKYNTTTKVWEDETKQTINVRQVGAPEDNKFVVETTKDWTDATVYNTSATNKNYYNDSYRLAIAAGKVTNASNGKTNAAIELLLQGAMKTPDVDSPKISVIDETTKGKEYKVTMSEPVKFPSTGGGNGDSWETKAETQTSIPTPTAQFIKKDGSVTIDADVTPGTDAYNKEITVKPQGGVELEGGVWTLVVRSISDDVGNTASSDTKDFTVETEVVSDSFRVVWSAADSDGSYANGLDEIAAVDGKDAVYVKFSQPVKTTGGSASALTTTNYTLNGDPLPKGTQIVANIAGHDDVDNIIDSVTIVLPDGTLTGSIDTTVITVSPYIQNAAGERLSNGGQFKLRYNYVTSYVPTDVADFKAKLKDESIRSINAGALNLSAEDVVVNRLVDINFTGNMKSLTVNTTEGGKMTIAGGTVDNNLTVNTPNADFTVAAGTTVTGTTTIKDVASSTFTNLGTLAAVRIEDSNGTSFVNSGTINGVVTVDATGKVKLTGNITSVVVEKAAKIEVVSGTIDTLTSRATGVQLTGAGTVTTPQVDGGTIVDADGQEVAADATGDQAAAEDLAAAKTTANEKIAVLTNTYVGKVTADNKAAAKTALEAAEAAVTTYTGLGGKTADLTGYANIATVIGEIKAVELAAAKTAAKLELDTYVTADDYTTNVTALSDAIAAGKTAIDAATTTEEVATAVSEAKVAIDAIETDAEIALAEAIVAISESIDSVTLSIADGEGTVAVGDTVTIGDVVYTVSTNGTDVATNAKWVTTTHVDTLIAAIEAAKTARDLPSATDITVNEAKTALDEAITQFTGTDAKAGTQE